LASTRGRLGLVQDLKFAVRHHWVPVFLAQEFLLEQDVDGWRKCSRKLALKQADGAGVLLAAKDELGLAFALHLVSPGRHGDGHQDGHHGQRHEQRGHHITLFVPALSHFLTRHGDADIIP
jgi:hypothetical protein